MKIDYNLNAADVHRALLSYVVQKPRVVWSGDLALNSEVKSKPYAPPILSHLIIFSGPEVTTRSKAKTGFFMLFMLKRRSGAGSSTSDSRQAGQVAPTPPPRCNLKVIQ